jgi:hypothetical protein
MPTATVRFTPRERRVLVLAAQGYTIRQIAEMLYVSHKTVEAHLRNVFTKMGRDPPDGGGAEVREPRRTPPSPGSASASADETSG